MAKTHLHINNNRAGGELFRMTPERAARHLEGRPLRNRVRPGLGY